MFNKNDLEEIFFQVKTAGTKICQLYHKTYQVETKKDRSKVTEADYISNHHLVNFLTKNYRYAIISEENKNQALSMDKTWVIDPIDGTQDFIEKTGDFSIMLALLEKQKVIFSLIYLPLVETFYYAQKNQGSFKRNANKDIPLKISFSANETLEDLVMFISRNHFSTLENNISKEIGITKFIKMGSIGIKISKIAEGIGNAYINISSSLGIWDMAPPYLILKEAGGSLMDLRGEEINFVDPNFKIKHGCIAASKREISNHLLKSYHKYKKIESV